MTPVTRSPDPAFQILHASFAKFRLASGTVERIASGCRWAEGPVWIGDGRCLLWSDIPNNRIMRWDEETGAVSVFRKPSGNANGNTRDRQGRLITCEHGGRQVTRTEYDGRVTVLLDRFRRQATEFAQRCGREIRRQCLVHRSDLRDRRLLPGREGRAGVAGARLPHRPAVRRRDSRGRWDRRAERARFFARREPPLYRRIARGAEDPILRRHGRRRDARPRTAANHGGRWNARRLQKSTSTATFGAVGV